MWRKDQIKTSSSTIQIEEDMIGDFISIIGLFELQHLKKKFYFVFSNCNK